MLSSFQFKLIFILILIYTESKILNKKEVFYQTGRVGCKAVRICSTAVHRNRFCRCGGADVRHADQDGAWYRQRNLKSSMSWDFYISTFTNPRYPVSHKETKRGGGAESANPNTNSNFAANLTSPQLYTPIFRVQTSTKNGLFFVCFQKTS